MLTYIKQIVYGVTGWQWLAGGSCNQCLRSWHQGKPFIEGPDGVLFCRQCIDLLHEQFNRRREQAAREPFDVSNPYASPKVQQASKGTGVCHFCQVATVIVGKPGFWTRYPICVECVCKCKDLLDAEAARRAEGD